MSRVNIGPVVRAKKWRSLYARVWFILLSLSVFAVLYLSEHTFNEILFRLPLNVDLPWGTSPGPRFLAFVSVILVYSTGAIFLLCKTGLKVSLGLFLALAALYLAFLLRLLFVPSYVRFYGSSNADTVDLMSKAFALPGLVVSLLASWNENRYHSASKSLLSASDLSLIRTFERTKPPKVDLPPEGGKSSAYESLRIVTIAIGIFVVLLLWAVGVGVSSLMLSFLLIANWLYYLSQKHNVRTAEEVAQFDSRLPVLLLRSFKSDRRLTQTEGHPYTSLIDRLVKLLRPVGHPIALPDPKIPLPFPGVAAVPVPITEGLAEVADWQNEFNRRVQESGLIVMFASDSSGLLWEIRELLARPEALQRTALVFTGDLKSHESKVFLNFLRSLEGAAVAGKLYDLILDSTQLGESKPNHLSSQTHGLDKLLFRKYRADTPLLIRFSSCGNPLVIDGPLVWEGYKEAFERYVLAD